MKKYFVILLLSLLCACSSDEPQSFTQEPSTIDSQEGSDVEDSMDEVESAAGESTLAEFVTQEEFDTLIVGHLWAGNIDKLWCPGEPYNSDGEKLAPVITGGWYDFRGFKIVDGKVYDYRRASSPGFYIDPAFQVVIADSYNYDPSTGELVYVIPTVVTKQPMERRIILKSIENDRLSIRDRFGSFYIGTPTMDNQYDWSNYTEDIDAGSHYRYDFIRYSADKEAEYVQDFVLMN